MALFDSDEERTEAPSQYRREEFRRQGTVALSREILSVGLLTAVGGALFYSGETILLQFRLLADKFFKIPQGLDLSKSVVLDWRVFIAKAIGWSIFPVMAVGLVVGLILCAIQVGFYWTWEPLSPKWERLDPIAGFQRLFSGNGATEALKALGKLVLAAVVVYLFMRSELFQVGHFFGKSVLESTLISVGGLARIFFTLVAVFAAIAGFDYWYQRMQVEKQMRLTKREAKEEFKLREGDPLIKSRIRSLQKRMAGQRMMEEVPKADVVVTNPTHLAVALKYDPEKMSAPRVTAKGAGVVAEKIREVARKSRIPIVENKPLARTLFKEIDIGHSIPRELYKAVAEVLAYVYRLKNASYATA